MRTACYALVFALHLPVSALAQGFVNLDFEQAVVVPTDPTYGFLDWSLAVPGWGPSMSPLYYGQGHVGVEPLYLLMDSTSPVWTPGTQLAGEYSLYFHSGNAYNDPSGEWLNAFILQSGLVPSSARSIQMLAVGTFKVFLGRVEIPMFSLGGNSYGGDVSRFAGDTLNLAIVNNANEGHWGEGVIVDNIEFSPEPIPEPAAASLLAVGAGALLWRGREAHRRERDEP